MTPLNLLRNKFDSSDHLRAEWSLETDGKTVVTRPHIVWVGSEKDPANSLKAFRRMTDLLDSLNCPDVLIDEQVRRSRQCITQGIGIPTDLASGSKRLLLHYFEYENRYIAFKWHDNTSFEMFTYRHYNLHEINLASINNEISTTSRSLLRNIFTDQRAQKHATLWTKHNNSKLEEIYIALPWLPTLKDILHHTHHFINEQISGDISPYYDINLKYVGINCLNRGADGVSFYFCSSLIKGLPETISELDETIAKSAKNVSELIGHHFCI